MKMPLTAEQIEAEITKVLRVPQLPSKELFEVAIHYEWLPVRLQNLILNTGFGRQQSPKLTRAYLSLVSALCDGYARDFGRATQDGRR